MSDETLKRGRLKKELAAEVQEKLTLPLWWASHHFLFKSVNHINIAHVIMLEEKGILERQAVCKILEILLDLEFGDPARVHPGIGGEFYLDLEKYIIGRIGEENGGKMHIGRSRNDLIAAAQRMALRDPLDKIIGELVGLIGEEINLAEAHIATIMPGYTHLQPAQPITVAHYFLGHEMALTRNARRMENVHAFLNRCPLGAGALAGVTFSIDRYRTAELLGFEGIMENALDAVASRDYIFDICAALAMTACDLSRLSEDLYIWNTYEFGFIEIGDEYAEMSSIMPQKKNAFVLEHCRGRTGQVYGDLLAVLTALKGVPFTHSRDVSVEAVSVVWGALESTSSIVTILPGFLRALKFQFERMKKLSEENFSTVTDLADVLVREKGLSFRTAHHIVARVVDRMISQEKKPLDITTLILDEAAVEIVGNSLCLDEKVLQGALDPSHCIERRNLPGGPAQIEMMRQIELAKKELAVIESNLKKRIENRKKKENELLVLAKSYFR